jgi:3-oxoadipate enol-lactonase
MLGWGSLSPEGVVRRGLETATSGTYRAKRGEEFEQIVSWRLADSPSSAAYYEQARAGAGFDLSRGVEHITSPTLVIHGAEDRYVPVANAAALAGAIPGARLRVLDRAGHLVFIERFADVNREVVGFLKPRGSRRQAGANVQRARRRDRVLGWIREVPRSLWRWSGRLWDSIF